MSAFRRMADNCFIMKSGLQNDGCEQRRSRYDKEQSSVSEGHPGSQSRWLVLRFVQYLTEPIVARGFSQVVIRNKFRSKRHIGGSINAKQCAVKHAQDKKVLTVGDKA